MNTQPACGNEPGLPDATETPVAALFREWMRLCAEEAAAYAADPEGEGQACEAATDRKLAVERQLRDAPKLNLADLGLAVMATTEFGCFGVPCDVRDRYRAEARVMVQSIRAPVDQGA